MFLFLLRTYAGWPIFMLFTPSKIQPFARPPFYSTKPFKWIVRGKTIVGIMMNLLGNQTCKMTFFTQPDFWDINFYPKKCVVSTTPNLQGCNVNDIIGSQTYYCLSFLVTFTQKTQQNMDHKFNLWQTKKHIFSLKAYPSPESYTLALVAMVVTFCMSGGNIPSKFLLPCSMAVLYIAEEDHNKLIRYCFEGRSQKVSTLFSLCWTAPATQ